jgi:hypothetical protein
MSDEAPAPAQAPAPFDIRPQPVPLPVTEWNPRRKPPSPQRRKVFIAIAAAAVVLVFLAGCCLAGPLFLEGVGSLLGDGVLKAVAPRIWSGTPNVYWTGGGQYLVIQSLEVKVTGGRTEVGPLVTVVRLKTGGSVTVPGYRVVSVESAAPRVWLVPDPAPGVPGTTAANSTPPAPPQHQAFDGWDEPAPLLRVWDVTRPSSTISLPADEQWQPWRGPSGIVARLTVDPSVGSSPARLSFEQTSQPPVTAIAPGMHPIPGDARTFEPVGWSPSGRYFAVVALVRRASDTEDYGPTLQDTKDFAPVQALVYSTSDGSLVASCGVGAVIDKDLRRQVAWGAGNDVLYCISAADSVARPGTPLETDYIRSLSVIQPSADPVVQDFFAGQRGMAYAFDGYPASLLGGGSDLVLTSPSASEPAAARGVWHLEHPEPTLVSEWDTGGAPLAWASAADGTVAVLRSLPEGSDSLVEVATGKPRDRLEVVWSLHVPGQADLTGLRKQQAGASTGQ